MSQHQITCEGRLHGTITATGLINFAAMLVVFGLISWFRETIGLFTPEEIHYMFVLALIYTNCMEVALAFTLSSQLPRLAAAPSRTNALHFLFRLLGTLAAGFIVAALLVSTIEGVLGVDIDDSPVTKIISSVWSLMFCSMVWICVFGYESMTRTLENAALQISLQELQQERSHKLALEAQLSSLQSRTNPHFLFNALNSIAALIPEDPARAEHMVGRLASLLRFSLDSAQKRTVPLSQELHIVSDYLEIEKTRFQNRIRYNLEVEPGLESVEVPPLALQTLVENSVKYAISPRREGGTVRIVACQIAALESDEANVLLQVWDNGPGFSLQTLPLGHGLDSLKARLQVLYGPCATPEAEMRDAPQKMIDESETTSRWMVVTLLLPRHPV